VTSSLFLRLLPFENKAAALHELIETTSAKQSKKNSFIVDSNSFSEVPGAPFAYWVSDRVRRLFLDLPQFEDESKGRTTRCGLGTLDDFRFLRLRWEVPSQALQARFSPYYHGGAYSPFYDEFPLVVHWGAHGKEIKDFVEKKVGSASRKVQGEDHYFMPGFVFPRRTKAFSPKIMPAGGIYSTAGQAVFLPRVDLLWGLGVLSSNACNYLIALSQGTTREGGGGNPQFEVGLVKRLPWPEVHENQKNELAYLTHSIFTAKRSLSLGSETSCNFTVPSLIGGASFLLGSIAEQLAAWRHTIVETRAELTRQRERVEEIACQLYDISDEDRKLIEQSLNGDNDPPEALVNDSDMVEKSKDSESSLPLIDGRMLVADLLSYTVGCSFGRWDARIALNPSLAPELTDPFTPLPVCSPGMLVGPDGLPAQRNDIASEEWMRARPDAITLPSEDSVENPTIPDAEYPLAVDWDGILVDDPEHEDDILRRVRDVLDLLWGERADAIEQEACERLSVKDLRTYFRNPRKFFDYHIKRYSKGRRKAPIYWLLQSPKRNYGLWLYYHRLDPDILFKALQKYVEPKIRLDESRLEEYEARRRSAGTGSHEAKQAEKAVEKQEEQLTDLREFRDRLARAAKLHLRPDLNDGVVLNIAPLHELVPWKEVKSKWNELLSGKYEWSSIGKQLREKGMI
jgi:hypothetical protein